MYFENDSHRQGVKLFLYSYKFLYFGEFFYNFLYWAKISYDSYKIGKHEILF